MPFPQPHNLEQGSPTGVLAGADLNFPAQYKDGIFIMDWSFGTMYYLDLQTSGSSYTAERTEFLSGTPLPLTDMITGADGNMYFATGGRRINSHLFRLRYTGPDSQQGDTTVDQDAQKLRELRHSLEAHHVEDSADGIPLAWANLDHEDRHIRYAARIALEHQAVAEWLPLYLSEKEPKKIIEASLGLARQGGKELQSKILAKLNAIPLETQVEQQQLNILRAYELLFIRMGEPSAQDGLAVAKRLKSYFPHANSAMNRELGQLLLYLKADGTVEKLVALLDKHTKDRKEPIGNLLSEEITMRSEQYGPLIREILAKMPPSEAIYYGVLLSHAESGWTREARSTYFQWFYDVFNSQGGLSFKPGMENIRQAAMAHVPDDQKEYFQQLSGVYSPSNSIADLPQPEGPSNQFTATEMRKAVWGEALADYKPDFAKGEKAFQAATCVLCHRVRGEGGAAGPDLTQISDKFGRSDLLFAIYSPNDEISDQYAHTLFHLKDGKKISGRVKSETKPPLPSCRIRLTRAIPWK